MEISPEGVVTLAKAEVSALAAYATTDTTRVALGGVWIEREFMRAFATDGHRAIMARRLGGHWIGRAPAVLVPRATMIDAARMCRAHDAVRIFAGGRHGAEDGGGRTLGAGAVIGLQIVDTRRRTAEGECLVRTSLHCPVQPDDVKPPPIDHVMRVPVEGSEPGAPVFAVNVSYLAEVALLCKAATVPSVLVYPGSDAEAAVGFRATDETTATEWTAVVMPVKAHVPSVTAPDAVRWAAERIRTAHGADAAQEVIDAFERALALPPAPPKRNRRLHAV